MIEIKNLSVSYTGKRTLDNINLAFEKGLFYCIIGRNGAGKSTLASCLTSLVKYDGEILLDGRTMSEIPLADRAKKISLLPQSVKDVPFTALELVSFGRNPHGDMEQRGEILAKAALEEAGIGCLSEKRVDRLSGGERQLCYFALSLCQDADVLILDEPTSSLDVEYAKRILDTAKKRCAEGKTVICIIHSLSDAVKYADRIVILDGGRVSFSGTREECLEKGAIEEGFGVRKFVSGSEIFFAV